MALPRSLNRLELALPQTLGEPVEREALAALSQHKLNALGVPLAYIDLDNLKRLELEAGQREHRLRLVTDSVGLPILYVDRQLKLRFANKPFGNWVGVPADDVLGHLLKEVLPADAMAEMHGYIERAFAGAQVSYERRERHLSGESRWMRITLFPDREVGGRVGTPFVVVKD